MSAMKRQFPRSAWLGVAWLGVVACGGNPVDANGNDGGTSADAAATDVAVSDGGVTDGGATDVAAPDAAVADAGPSPEAGPPPGMLDTSIVSQIVEPEGGGKDDANNSFTDKNYWNFCMPGAATVALYYFHPSDVTAWPAGSFKEPTNAPSTIPAGGTYWDSKDKVNGYATYGRAYLMHLAEQVKPPTYNMAGMVSFASYPSTGANLTDLRDALNWEASGHASGWSTFFYSIVSANSMTLGTFHADIKKTIDGGHAVVVTADTGLLPNWSRSLSHAITVVGYDDKATTYKYTDTCGIHCNGSAKAKNGGVWTIAQSGLFDAVKADGAGYVK